MPRLVVSNEKTDGSSGTIGTEGKLWWMRPIAAGTVAAADIFNMVLPAGVRGLRRRPSWVTYNQGGVSRTYGTGAFTSNILVDEHFRALKQGIPAPVVTPTVAAGAGPGRTGIAIFFWRFLDNLGQRVGPLSGPSAPVTLTNESAVATSLPTTCPDSSVSHIQQLCSMDGALPRVEWTRQLGVTSVTSNVATGALGEAAPDDFVEIPNGTINIVYNDVQVVSGNQQFPERAFLSALEEFERYEGLFVQTEGEPVVGMFAHDNSVFMGSKKRIYGFTGFEGTDISRNVVKPDIGLIGHHGIRNCHGKVIVPTTQGFYLVDGLWHFLLDDRQTEWAREYATYREQYEAAGSLFDPIRNVYKFGPVPHSEFAGINVYWVLDLERLIPELEQTEFRNPAWKNDGRSRLDTTATVWELPGSGLPEVVVGSGDGFIRRENISGDVGDDGDAYLKHWIIEPATVAPDLGGSLTDGITWQKIWQYIVAPGDSWTQDIRSGNENCRANLDPVWTQDYIGGLEVDAENETIEMDILEGVAGACLNVVLSGDNALSTLRWRGYGGTHSLGIRRRGGVQEGGGG